MSDIIEYVNAAELVARFKGDPVTQKKLVDTISTMERISKSRAKRQPEPELMDKLNRLYDTYTGKANLVAKNAPSVAKLSKADLMRWVIGCLEAVIKREKNLKKKAAAEEELAKKDADKKRLEEHLAYIEAQKQTPKYNTGCRHYVETIRGDVCERSCDADMDMTFCGDHCAFASNRGGSTKIYQAPVYENGRPMGRT